MNNSHYSTPFDGIPVIQTTRITQRRTHKRSRINKKWRKRYGMIKREVQSYDLFEWEGKLYVTEAGYNALMGIKTT